MSEWQRTMLGMAATMVYMMLIGMKYVDRNKLAEAEKEGSISKEQSEEARQSLRFDMIRLFADCTVLVWFLMVPLCPAWFGLFPGTASGFCAACLVLVSLTLVISVFVDWIPVRRSCRRAGEKVPPFGTFLLRQFFRVLRIECALALVWGVFRILEPTQVGTFVKVGVSALALLLFRGLIRLVRRLGKRNDG